MLDKDGLLAGVYVVGPLAVLSGLVLSVVSLRTWSRNVRETACAWRIDYSPASRAFGPIWSLIYAGTVAVVVAQVTNQVVVFDWWVNFLWALAWMFCALWVPFFDAQHIGALRAAMVQILAAAACATAATGLSRMWLVGEGAPPERRVEQVALGWPLSIFAGWLVAASAINVGIVAKASDPTLKPTCVREASRGYEGAYADMPVRVSIVPVLLACGVGGVTVWIRDPLYAVPLMWALVNLPAFPCWEYFVALLLCAGGSAGAVVRVIYA